MTDAQVIVYLLVGLMALAGTIGTAVLAARQKATEALLREQREALADLREQVAANEARIEKLERRDRAWANYVHKLRAHIEKRLGPPPPEWPVGLDV